jgi:hypothetical protein
MKKEIRRDKIIRNINEEETTKNFRIDMLLKIRITYKFKINLEQKYTFKYTLTYDFTLIFSLCGH